MIQLQKSKPTEQGNIFPFQSSSGIFTYPTPHPTTNQCCLAYYVVYTLHVSLYRRVLGITTMGDWRRMRDRGVERNFKMFSCFQCFKLKKNPQSHFVFVLQNSALSFRRFRYEKQKRKHQFFDTLGLFTGIYCASQ